MIPKAILTVTTNLGRAKEMTDKIDATPFQERLTWPIEVRELHGWKLKVYGICADGCELNSGIIEGAMRHALTHVCWPAGLTGYGFVTLHYGEEAVWLLVDLWVNEILRHFVYQASLSHPEQFTSGPNDGTVACVWELAVVTHERKAWIEHVLSRPLNPAYDTYLLDTIRIDPV